MSRGDGDDNSGNKRKREHKYLRNRRKYEAQYTAFDLKTESPIRNGMVFDRPTNDMIYGICFIIFFIAFIGITAYGIS